MPDIPKILSPSALDGQRSRAVRRVRARRQRSAQIAIVGTLLLIAMSTANAQSTTVIPNAGEITTISKVDNGVLSVSNQIVRNRSQVRECVGACFYASKTITKTWICRASNCALDCSGREPIGGC